MERDWPFELNLDAENARIKTNPASSFDASVRGAGSLATRRLDRMTAVIRNLRLATPGQDTISDGPVQISYADRQLRVEHLALRSGDSNLSVTGAIPLLENAAPASLSLQGRLVLNRFSSFFPEMHTSDLRGVAQAECDPHRKWSALDPNGFSSNPGWRFYVAIDPAWHREAYPDASALRMPSSTRNKSVGPLGPEGSQSQDPCPFI